MGKTVGYKRGKKEMEVNGWRYYNHAALPDVAPHVNVNLTPLNDGSIWKMGGGQSPIS